MSEFNITEHVIGASHVREYARATSDDQDATLRLHIKQYTPKDNPSPRKGDVTIIGAHANGFPKELYEPLWDHLHQELKKQGIRIRHVWIADCAWQGQSGILNQAKGLLGNDPGWYDHSRDTIHMINTFRMPRPLVAIGHSFGGGALAHAALLHPRLFHSMIMLDAVIAPYGAGPSPFQAGLAAASARRRDAWPSRQMAAESFRKSPLYQSWDPRVFDQWIRYGLRNTSADPDGEVTLATTKHQEVFTFLRPSWPAFDADGRKIVNPEWVKEYDTSQKLDVALFPFYRPEPITTFQRITHLRPGVVFINGGKSRVIVASEVKQRTAMTGTGPGGSGGVKTGRVKEVTHPDYGHLVPLEDPAFCAREISAFLGNELAIWTAGEREYEEWAKQSNYQKTTLSQDWKTHLKIKDNPKPKM
ncbi:hypothetical protein C2857_005923 [Epichloe festucae Fl1]|uniref:AB hydrolase-1 domain-containing protein n=1 Tax=Epichloe festucae (strain Fl1) TaxID=877507 RepID=A0A7S9KLF3_EPIFF|nr:hypothetical protein C2857_005923 [Epichloe festucae Fl1]